MFGFFKNTALWASLLVASTLLESVSTSPVASFDNDTVEFDLEKRGGSFAIRGVPGGVHPRLEIRTLYKDHKTQWHLYLLAMRRFQSLSQSNQLSYFQIAGIHGAPNIPWDHVPQSAPGIGYCTHAINLFPTWHRPYVALFEQRLVAAARLVASEFPAKERKKYVEAAATLRAPYWDWAIDPAPGLPSLPAIITAKTVVINIPHKGLTRINNPLYSYAYHPLNAGDFSPYSTPWSYWPRTLRWPQTTAKNAYSHDATAVATVNRNRAGQKQNLYNWFTLCPRYLQISNDQPSGSSSSCHISLESLHNNIHLWVGGNNDGHMTVIPVSANDPTFMLHHTQIDRLFAMWQGIYPNSYITPQRSNVDTFTIKKGSIQSGNSPLKPFHRDTKGHFWTSNEVRNWRIFHYTYPEFANSNGSPAAIRAAVNRLYGPNSSAHAARHEKRDLEREDEQIQEDAMALSRRQVPDVPTALVSANNGSTFQYIANVATTRFGLNGSYSVFMFMGDPTTEDASTWGTDSNLIGSVGVFSTPGMTNSDLVTTSAVPLTDALVGQVGAGLLQALDEVFVVPYLQSKLTWRVATTNLEVIDPDTIPDFVVSVVASTMQPPASEEDFPVWSPFSVLTQITHGKAGGLPIGGALSYLGL